MVLLTMRWLWCSTLVILMASLAGPAVADDAVRAEVVDTEVRVAADWVHVDIQLRNLIDMRTASTIDSGLSGVCVYEVSLLGNSDEPVGRRVWTLSLEHDLWEDRYYVRGDQVDHDLPTLAAMDSLCSRVDNLRLLPADRLDPETDYRLTVSVEVLPLASVDQDRLSQYVSRRGGGTREELDLDLGSIFGRLLGGGRAGRTSVSYTSPPFRARSMGWSP